MDINEIKEIALSTFMKLVELIKRDDCYSYLIQISTSYNSRMYVGFCILTHTNIAILHEEYDLSPKIDNTRLVSKDFIMEYIKNMDDIIFVGLRESSDPDEELIVYYIR